MGLLDKIFGDSQVKQIKNYLPLIEKINQLESELGGFSDEKLKERSLDLKDRVISGEVLDNIIAEAFALVRETAMRKLGQRHYDVQLIGGAVLHHGKIAEMKTGEGKTLSSTLPVYLNALSGNGVHVVTVNDYLSRRDTVWMGQIYDALGLTVGCINHDGAYLYDAAHSENQKLNIKNQNDNLKLKNDEEAEKLDKVRDTLGAFKVVHEFLRPVGKKEAYTADITYGTNNEFGFDYLRDNMAYDPSQLAQRGHNFAIVDEVDSILIDEARTPLIISAPDAESPQFYATFAKVARRLNEGEDYTVDEKLKAVSVTEEGVAKVEKIMNVQNLYDEGGSKYVHYLEQSLRAKALFFKDKDYVVKDGEIIIVDEFTGRMMPGRRWSQGLHQAIEAKEDVSVQKESRTMATITFQNYFKLYKKIAGMTGTALTSAEEFHKVYGLDVVAVPTNKSVVRKDYDDKILKTEAGKWKVVANEIKNVHAKGQPILIGTVSIEKNELLSAMLKREGLPFNVLNAKNHEREAEIIAQAGRKGAITVATNMAGRGVDIILGGNPINKEEAAQVRELGGLHVIGTERHEARRIDNQLRGRSGRQGDPGSSRFFVSLEDDIVRIFGGEKIKGLLDRLGLPEDEPIENKFISRAIEQAQEKVEGHNFDARKYVLEFDNVMNKHRDSIYTLRNDILHSKEVAEKSRKFVNDYFKSLVETHAQGPRENWNIKEIVEHIKTVTGRQDDLESVMEQNANQSQQNLLEFAVQTVDEEYSKKRKEIGDSIVQIERQLLLQIIDHVWVDHLEAMDHLRQSVNLRAYGQRDPLAEYRAEGHRMFGTLIQNIQSQFVNVIFKINITQDSVAHSQSPKQLVLNKNEESANTGGKLIQNKGDSADKIGRNDPCYCGSGKKYKKCHGR